MMNGQKSAYAIAGFLLSLGIAVLTTISLQVLFAWLWTPPPSFLVDYGSALAFVIFSVAATWLYLLQTLKNEAMIRGVWYQIYSMFAVAAICLPLAIWT